MSISDDISNTEDVLILGAVVLIGYVVYRIYENIAAGLTWAGNEIEAGAAAVASGVEAGAAGVASGAQDVVNADTDTYTPDNIGLF